MRIKDFCRSVWGMVVITRHNPKHLKAWLSPIKILRLAWWGTTHDFVDAGIWNGQQNYQGILKERKK